MRTPAWRGTLLAHAALVYLTAPVAAALYYREQAERGAYPPGAESIAVLIYGTAISLALLSPLLLSIVLYALRGYRSRIPWNYLDAARPVPTLAWSLLFGATGLAAAFVAVTGLFEGHVAPSIHALAVVHLCVLLRAAAVASQSPEGGRPAAPGWVVAAVLAAVLLLGHLSTVFDGLGLAQDYPWYGKLYWAAGTVVPHALVACTAWLAGATGALYGMAAAVLGAQMLMHVALAGGGDAAAQALFFGGAAQVYLWIPPLTLIGWFLHALFSVPQGDTR